jgi:transposase
MSNALLYQMVGVSGYRLTRHERDQGRLLLYLEPQPHRVCCPCCKSKDVVRRGTMLRGFRGLPIGGRMTFLFALLPRVACRRCKIVRQIDHGLAEPRRGYTRAFARYALELSRYMTIKDVANHLLVSWDVIKDIQRTHLEKHYAKPPLAGVRQIAIDEVCLGRRRFVTIVLDLDSGAILFVGEGKNAAALRPFWRRVRCSRANIKAVAIDLSKAYIAAVRDNLPDAKIVFDRFHVVQLMNQKLTTLRRELYHEATARQKRVLKGTRWLLLKHPDNLDAARDETGRLYAALRLNESLATAYYLKEELRQIWEQPDKRYARRALRSWHDQATASGIRVLHIMARTLLIHAEGILAWYDYPISTGPLEGTHNKTKTMQRQHYGLRDQEFLKLKLYALHEAKYALVG